MNYEWMRERLASLLAECEEYARSDRGDWNEGVQRPIMNRVEEQVPTVRRIIDVLDPTLIPEDFGINVYMSGLRSTSNAVRQALAVLRDREDLRANLQPDAPSIIADRFHESVWRAAAVLWPTGEYRSATANAATSLSAHIKNLAGSHLNERELVQQVFSPEPPKTGQRRLHLPGDTKDKNWRSAQEGLHLIAQGAFAGIRNPAVHSDSAWSEQVALEHLAVLSVVARWADETKVVTPS